MGTLANWFLLSTAGGGGGAGNPSRPAKTLFWVTADRPRTRDCPSFVIAAGALVPYARSRSPLPTKFSKREQVSQGSHLQTLLHYRRTCNAKNREIDQSQVFCARDTPLLPVNKLPKYLRICFYSSIICFLAYTSYICTSTPGGIYTIFRVIEKSMHTSMLQQQMFLRRTTVLPPAQLPDPRH